ncbi:MAG: exodeoxyribonuclease III [Patescibacteria group bacterium]|nr:exodeoxyribonuclease III [Patescibacteria group bacterium]
MRIISWNVNGIRAVIKKGFLDFLKKEKPDILCLQETKIAQKDIDKLKFSAQGGPAPGWDFAGYKEYWNPAQRPGYSGTAILARKNLKLSFGYPKLNFRRLPWDDEGRIQIMDIGRYYLANVYFPNANHELSRLDFKINFNNKLLKEIKKLEAEKPCIVCGDYNVAREEIDLARPKENEGSAGFTQAERNWMTKFLNSGFIDTFRYFYPNKIEYSWWSYRMRARDRNIGWRIDYFCASDNAIKNIKKAFILNQITGSDHCPVGINFE